MRHAHDIALPIVFIGVHLRSGARRAERCPAEAVAHFGLRTAAFDQTRLEIVVRPRPAGMCGIGPAVLHLKEIADGVVHVTLDVGPDGGAIAGMIDPSVKPIK